MSVNTDDDQIGDTPNRQSPVSIVDKACNRLYSEQTQSSLSKHRISQLERRAIDSLDYILKSCYDHSKELFPDKEDIYLQTETKYEEKFRHERQKESALDDKMIHPIKYGGIEERRSPHSVQLMNSGHHSAKTAPGYSRQPAGGTIYFY